MSDPNTQSSSSESSRRTWTEEIELAGNQLVQRVQELIAEGNVRWLIVKSDGRPIIQIPLTVAAPAAAAAVLMAPVLAALGAAAALISRVQVSIVREGEPPRSSEPPK